MTTEQIEQLLLSDSANGNIAGVRRALRSLTIDDIGYFKSRDSLDAVLLNLLNSADPVSAQVTATIEDLLMTKFRWQVNGK